VGFGCDWAKLDVVFLCRQVRWQNTSFNFAKGWHFCLSFIVGRVGLLGLLVTIYYNDCPAQKQLYIKIPNIRKRANLY